MYWHVISRISVLEYYFSFQRYSLVPLDSRLVHLSEIIDIISTYSCDLLHCIQHI